MAECPYCKKPLLLAKGVRPLIEPKPEPPKYQPVAKLEYALLEYVKSMPEDDRIKLNFTKEDKHIIVKQKGWVAAKHWRAINKIVMAHGGKWVPKEGGVGHWEVSL